MKLSLSFLLFCLVITHFRWSYAQSIMHDNHNSLHPTKVLEDSTKNIILRKKSPTGALLRSMVFPGWGQWYNGQKIKAAIAFTAEGFLVGLAIYLNKRASESVPGTAERNFYIDRRNLTYWVLGGVTLFSMLDAYVDAYLHDFDTGPDLALRIGALYPSTSMEMPMILGFSLRAKF